jgi:ERCC4-type nuclease
MRTNDFTDELLKNLELLSTTEQEKALAYVKSLLPQENNHSKLLTWVGGIDAKSIKEMEEAIEEGYEKIDANAW